MKKTILIMKHILFYCIAIFLLIGCASVKNTEAKKNVDPIHIAINDFVRSPKPKDFWGKKTFFICMVDVNDSIVGVALFHSKNKEFIKEGENIVGTYRTDFPTDYLEKGNKFFYWNDPTKAVTQEILDKLDQYNLLEFGPMYVVTGRQKGFGYYFCKNNFSKYKKVISRAAVGSYEPPQIKCE